MSSSFHDSLSFKETLIPSVDREKRAERVRGRSRDSGRL